MRTTGIDEIEITPDARVAILHFRSTESDQTVSLEIETIRLAGMLQELVGIVMFARQHSDLFLQNFQAFTPAQAKVDLVEDGDSITLSLRMPNGLEYHFEFPPESAQRIGVQLLEKVKLGSERAGPTKN